MSYVVTGPDRRHVETAIAMGYAVDEMVTWPSGYIAGVVEHHDQWRWERPFERYAQLIQAHPSLREVANAHLSHWLRAVAKLAPEQTALVVSSGGSIEPALVAASPSADHAGWGTAFHHLQGATLTFDDDDRCVNLTLRR
jgi:broad specificity phosphatase PhoE